VRSSLPAWFGGLGASASLSTALLSLVTLTVCVALALTMTPITVVPELGDAAPGDACAVSPWTGRRAVARPGQLVCLRVVSGLLARRAVAVVVEPMSGCELYCHPREERDGDVEVFRFSQNLGREGRCACVFCFVYNDVYEGNHNLLLTSLRAFNERQERNTLTGLVMIRASYEPAFMAMMREPSIPRPRPVGRPYLGLGTRKRALSPEQVRNEVGSRASSRASCAIGAGPAPVRTAGHPPGVVAPAVRRQLHWDGQVNGPAAIRVTESPTSAALRAAVDAEVASATQAFLASLAEDEEDKSGPPVLTGPKAVNNDITVENKELGAPAEVRMRNGGDVGVGVNAHVNSVLHQHEADRSVSEKGVTDGTAALRAGSPRVAGGNAGKDKVPSYSEAVAMTAKKVANGAEASRPGSPRVAGGEAGKEKVPSDGAAVAMSEKKAADRTAPSSRGCSLRGAGGDARTKVSPSKNSGVLDKVSVVTAGTGSMVDETPAPPRRRSVRRG